MNGRYHVLTYLAPMLVPTRLSNAPTIISATICRFFVGCTCRFRVRNHAPRISTSITPQVTTTVSVSMKPPHSGFEISIFAPVISRSIVSSTYFPLQIMQPCPLVYSSLIFPVSWSTSMVSRGKSMGIMQASPSTKGSANATTIRRIMITMRML